jgi:hypothetical protein
LLFWSILLLIKKSLLWNGALVTQAAASQVSCSPVCWLRKEAMPSDWPTHLVCGSAHSGVPTVTKSPNHALLRTCSCP